MNQPLLSICIPTYNRADFLDKCLESLCSSAAGNLDKLEVVISDNASPDNTKEIVDKYQERLPIRYFLNSENIGCERNIMAVARRAAAEHIWVFGDDDLFEDTAVPSALRHIQLGYDLIVFNYSIWSRDMNTMRRPRGFPSKRSRVYNTPDEVIASLGSHLGYISGLVVRKRIFTATPAEEYQPFIEYGFSHLYSMYAGMLPACKAVCPSEIAFRNRSDNCDSYFGDKGFELWIFCFIYGTAIVFDSLQRKGYSRWAVVSAKNQVLRDFVEPVILTGMPGTDRRVVLDKMIQLYSLNWRFWMISFPGLIIPSEIVGFARKMFRSARRHLRPVRYA